MSTWKHKASELIGFDIDPPMNMETVIIKVIANVLEAFFPCTFLKAFLLFNKAVAKAAPEVVMSVSAKVHTVALTLDLVTRQVVAVSGLQMALEDILVLSQHSASSTKPVRMRRDLASPHFSPVML